MKRILLLLVLTLLSVNFSAQKKNDEFVKVEITKTDGNVITGYLDRVKIPELSTFQEMVSNANGSIFNSATKIFVKPSPDGKPEKISSSEVSKIKFLDKFDDQINSVEKHKLMTFNSRNEVIDSKKQIVLPQIYEGKIDIYGYTTISCMQIGHAKPAPGTGTGCIYVTHIYLKNKKENFFIRPLDINVFDVSQSFDRFVAAFKAAGNSCPAFDKYLDDFRVKMDDKTLQKNLRKDAIEKRKQYEKDSKQVEKKLRQQYIADRILEYDLQYYLGIIKEYEKNCQ